jgi:hypothetical protein
MSSPLGATFSQLFAAKRRQKELETQALAIHRQRNCAEDGLDAAQDRVAAAKEKWANESWRPEVEDAEANLVDAERTLEDLLKSQSAIWSEMKKNTDAIQQLEERMRALK